LENLDATIPQFDQAIEARQLLAERTLNQGSIIATLEAAVYPSEGFRARMVGDQILLFRSESGTVGAIFVSYHGRVR
jgi:hypothetical protein